MIEKWYHLMIVDDFTLFHSYEKMDKICSEKQL